MFEREFDLNREDTVWVDDRESRLADQHGISIGSRWITVNGHDVLRYAKQIDRVLNSGQVRYAREINRLKALKGSLLNTYGPDMYDLYKKESTHD